MFTLEELVERFSLERVNLAPQVFDLDKLKWLNRKHLARLSPEELLVRAKPFLKGLPEGPEEKVARALALVRPGISTLAELGEHPDLVAILSRPELGQDVLEELSKPMAQEALRAVLARLEGLPNVGLRALVNEVAGELGVSRRGVFHPLRLALTGRSQGPELAGVVAVLGLEEVRARIECALRVVEETTGGV